MSADRLQDWRQAQGETFPDSMDDAVTLGPIWSDSWRRDPKHVLFNLARYKFVAKMLNNTGVIAEVGAGDGFGAALVGDVDLYDKAPLADGIRRYDVMDGPLPKWYDAIYSVDVFEHVRSGELFFRHLSESLTAHGKLIVGTPSLESQAYASEPSRKLHINCVSGEDLRTLAQRFFHHVFMFGQNDEVVHTGFLPMSHYLWVVCAEPIR